MPDLHLFNKGPDPDDPGPVSPKGTSAGRGGAFMNRISSLLLPVRRLL